MNDFLQKILRKKQVEVAAAKAACPSRELSARVADLPPVRDFTAALRNSSGVIAELKKASPSKGLIRPDFRVEALAEELAAAGAGALSVLTEREYFLGSPENLSRVRRRVSLPLLRKDFLFDEYQILEARCLGADAVLLIAAMLTEERFRTLASYAHSLGLAVLGEAHNETELATINVSSVEAAGINARNLHSFECDLGCVKSMLAMLNAKKLRVAESSIRSRTEIDALRAAGAEAFLIGETLMRAERPGRKLAELLQK